MLAIASRNQGDRDAYAVPTATLIAAWPEVLTELENQRDEPARVTIADLRQQLAELTSRIAQAEKTIAALGRQGDLVTQSLAAINNQLQATTSALAASTELAAAAQRRADELEQHANQLKRRNYAEGISFLTQLHPQFKSAMDTGYDARAVDDFMEKIRKLATADMAQLIAYVRTHPHSFPAGIKVMRQGPGGKWVLPKTSDILSGKYYEPSSVNKFLAELDRALDNHQVS
jgi:septal ring factor EnvC (AmiA/AmiB activator)